MNTEEKGWAFPADEKETKRRARDMIRMVMDINTKHVGGPPVVTCNTCHNGHRRPAMTVALPTPAPEFPTPLVDRSAFPKAKDIVAKHVAAAGEPPRPTPRVLKGTRIGWDGATAPLEVYESGENIQIVAKTADGNTLMQTLTAQGGWVRDKDGARPMRASMVENLRDIARLFEPWSSATVSSEARVVAKGTVNGHEAWVVADGKTRLYFDAASGLLLRRLTLRETSIGRRPEQTDFDDYRAVGTARVPFTARLARRSVGGKHAQGGRAAGRRDNRSMAVRDAEVER